MDVRPELVDYLAFFEAEPEILDSEVGWYCGTRFISVRNDDRIVVVIAPEDGEFSFKWWQNGTLRADLNLKGVVDWRLEPNPKKEALYLGFHQPGIRFFSLRLRPAVCISWITEWA